MLLSSELFINHKVLGSLWTLRWTAYVCFQTHPTMFHLHTQVKECFLDFFYFFPPQWHSLFWKSSRGWRCSLVGEQLANVHWDWFWHRKISNLYSFPIANFLFQKWLQQHSHFRILFLLLCIKSCFKVDKPLRTFYPLVFYASYAIGFRSDVIKATQHLFVCCGSLNHVGNLLNLISFQYFH